MTSQITTKESPEPMDPGFAAYVRRGIAMAGLTGEPEIIRFTGGTSPSYRVNFPGGAGFGLTDCLRDDDLNHAAARCLSVLPGWALELARIVEDLRIALDKAEPVRVNLLGPGCVRIADTGAQQGLWLLNSAERGWAAFGVRVGDWDALFRRYNVRIGSSQIDATGQWWPAEPFTNQGNL